MRRKTFILAMAALIAVGCTNRVQSELGPEDTLKAFYESLCAGDFRTAADMCDTLGMEPYLTPIQETWAKADDSVKTILHDMLSETEVEITDMAKDGQERTIVYRLTGANGQTKEKTAVLKKEEGGWKIKTVTDIR